MTATKVECQEMNIDEPRVEEIASYSYTIQEDSSPKAQNGVLIEEYSESDENKSKQGIVNRGVSIVSVSDDESTLKAISRDVSTDDIQCAELSDDLKIVNGSFEEINSCGTAIEEKVMELRSHRASILQETIIEEKSLEESLPGKSVETSLEKPLKATVEDSKLTKEEAEEESVSSSKKVEEEIVDEPQTPTVEKRKLSKQTSKIERMESVPEKVPEEETLPGSEKATVLSRQSSKIERMESVPEKVPEEETLPGSEKATVLSRQSSKIERMESVESLKAERKTLSRENSQKGAPEEEVDEELEALLDRVKRQRSVLDDILDKESEREDAGMIETHQEFLLVCEDYE